MSGTGADWRRVVGALANGDARRVWAALVSSETQGTAGLSPPRERRALDLLEAAGLVRRRAEGMEGPGGYEPAEEVFRQLLAAAAANEPKAQGVERFLRLDGRIDRYPSGEADRRELLAHVVGRVLSSGETVSEREITDRLAAFSDDPVALRRYLVDAGLLERTPTGSAYSRAQASG